MYYIYENTNVLERVFLVDNVKIYENQEKLLEAMSKAALKDLQTTAYVESEYITSLDLDINLKTSNFIISKYSPDEISINLLDLDGKGILIVTNSYHPSWKAYVNGEKREIFPVNHAFWGIELDKGDQELILNYEPNYNKGLISFR